MNWFRSISGMGAGKSAATDAAILTPRQLARQSTAAADQARDRGDWTSAAALYAESLAILEDNAPIHIQHGHALKEAGRLDEAAAAYRQAARWAPEDPDPPVQLGHLLKRMGDQAGANAAFRKALHLDPTATGPRDELIDAGARGQLPDDIFGQAAAAVESARIAHLLTQGLHGLQNLAAVAAFPQGTHDAFRRQYPIQPPPCEGQPGPVTVRILAADATPVMLRATLASLIDQRHQNWTAYVTPAEPLSGHSVGSFGQLDSRIRFGAPSAPEHGDFSLLVQAGAVLDREALGWMTYALTRTGAAAVYCDHDHYTPDWRAGPVRHSPCLQTMFDPDGMAVSSSPPAVALFRDIPSDVPATAFKGLIDSAHVGTIAHLPRLLASLPMPTARAAGEASAARADRPAPDPTCDILVVIPTRDEHAILERGIRTLLETAANPTRVRIRIVDNQSKEPETTDTIERLTVMDAVDSFRLDEPFNWARCNNLAVARGAGDILVFANNDIEMLTPGWDDHVRDLLAREDIGVLGARLLYPNGTVQHAGILLGGWEGRPIHDGLGASPDEGGSLGRWRSTRATAAVTGAFMACRRGTFDTVGGFDERLAIAYNDIDFCLKVRELGLKVLYAAELELTHYESQTRGQNDSVEKVAWDNAELADLYAWWGPWLFHDPSYNPHWVNAINRPYDGIRDLAMSQVLAHLDASAQPNPWKIVR
ncbi:MAG: hypothetical protein Q8S03_04340 [Brevundimonas sp.]|uniref:glycosyltransferase family 2 protein n=1 Tax=Brevundimonas sp. TaxID=1871086 RepID=UPI00273538AB|nr:glycosyltransferase [Brevundimonas sp.]MDP3403897.1 hypothetical protein [Brevundimonas sp.]